MTRSWTLVVIAAVALVVTGCVQGADEGPSGPKPPDVTLTLGNRSVSGVLGSYCWTSPSSGATCADAAGIPVPPGEEALAVPAGSVMVFDFGGSRRPSSVKGVAYPLGRGNEVSGGRRGGFLVAREGRSALATEDLEVRREGNRTEIPAELPAGEEYVVDVFVRVPGGNDATYYFRVAVEGNAGKLPDPGDLEY